MAIAELDRYDSNRIRVDVLKRQIQGMRRIHEKYVDMASDALNSSNFPLSLVAARIARETPSLMSSDGENVRQALSEIDRDKVYPPVSPYEIEKYGYFRVAFALPQDRSAALKSIEMDAESQIDDDPQTYIDAIQNLEKGEDGKSRRHEIGLLHDDLGVLYMYKGEYAEAIQSFQKAYDVLKAGAINLDHTLPESGILLSEMYNQCQEILERTIFAFAMCKHLYFPTDMNRLKLLADRLIEMGYPHLDHVIGGLTSVEYTNNAENHARKLSSVAAMGMEVSRGDTKDFFKKLDKKMKDIRPHRDAIYGVDGMIYWGGSPYQKSGEIDAILTANSVSWPFNN